MVPRCSVFVGTPNTNLRFLNGPALDCIALRYVTLRYVTLRCVTLRYVTLRCMFILAFYEVNVA
jgi:hypothetical protein